MLAHFIDSSVSRHLCHEAIDGVGTRKPADPSDPRAWSEAPPFLAGWAPPLLHTNCQCRWTSWEHPTLRQHPAAVVHRPQSPGDSHSQRRRHRGFS